MAGADPRGPDDPREPLGHPGVGPPEGGRSAAAPPDGAAAAVPDPIPGTPDPEPGTPDPTRWPVLATRNSRLLLATRLTGQASDGLMQAALGSFVLFSPERQATAAQVAASFALLLLPYSLIGPFAGVLLDRWSRVRILVGANLARAAVMLAVAALVADDRDGLDLGATVLVAMGFGRLVLAGLSAGLPHVVASRHLVTANALFPTAGTIAAATATVTGLVLMPLLGPDAAAHLVLGVACGLVLAALIASRIPRDDLGPDEAEAAPGGRILAELADVVRGMVAGIGHIHARPTARRALAVVVLHRFAFGALLVDTLLLVRNTLNPPDQADAALADFALAAGGASAGSLLAAIVTPRLAGQLGITRWAGLTVLVASVAAPLTIARLTLPLLIVSSLLMGFSGQAVKIAGDTVLQREVEDDFRGRVFALYDVVLNVALVGGIFLTAFTVGASGVSPALWLGMGLLLAATAAWSLRPAPASG